MGWGGNCMDMVQREERRSLRDARCELGRFPRITLRFIRGSFENIVHGGICECGRGRPHDSRSGDRRYGRVVQSCLIFLHG